MPLGHLGGAFRGARTGKILDLLQRAREGEVWETFPAADKQPISIPPPEIL